MIISYRVWRCPNQNFKEGRSSSAVAVVTARGAVVSASADDGAVVSASADDGLPKAMAESTDVGRTEELSVNAEVSRGRIELSVNPEGTISRGRTEALELGF